MHAQRAWGEVYVQVVGLALRAMLMVSPQSHALLTHLCPSLPDPADAAGARISTALEASLATRIGPP